MDTRESNLAWIIAGVLFILLLIVGYLWLSSKQDINTVLENGQDRITDARAQIAEDCPGTDVAGKQRCENDLAELSLILSQFSADIDRATTTASTSGSAAI